MKGGWIKGEEGIVPLFPWKGWLIREGGLICEGWGGGAANREFAVQVWVIFFLKSARIKSGVLGQGVFSQIFQPLKNSPGTIWLEPHFSISFILKWFSFFRVRKQLNLDSNGAYKLSVNDFILKGCALACKKVPEANSSWMTDFIRQWVYLRKWNNVSILFFFQRQHGQVVSASDLQSGSPGFKSRSGDLLDLFSLITSSNPRPCL